jgi:hypothetical protein
MIRALDRRSFLRATGVSLALPWLESLGAAAGAKSAPPKRMIFICNALGLHSPALFPAKSGAGYESTEYLELLKDHRDDFTLFSGLSHPDQGGSEHATLMTWLSAARNPGRDGFRNSISIDQVAAERQGNVTRFPSILLSSDGPSSQSYTNSGVMIPAESSPSRMFAKMFLQGKPSEIAREKQNLKEGRSILDALMEQTKSLSRKASAADRERLNEYLESVRQTERELLDSREWLDQPKPKVTQDRPTDISDKSDLVGRVRLLLSLVPLIVQSDSSRIVSIVIQDHLVVPQVPGVTSEHHNLSHHGKDPAKIAQLKKIERELVSCFHEFLMKMKGTKEADGSLLDSTMTLFGSNLGNANAHDPRNLPILLAGGSFKHGQHVAYNRRDNTPLSNLYLRMLHEMAIDTDRFATSSGELNW